jgi:hypothetical protein
VLQPRALRPDVLPCKALLSPLQTRCSKSREVVCDTTQWGVTWVGMDKIERVQKCLEDRGGRSLIYLAVD